MRIFAAALALFLIDGGCGGEPLGIRTITVPMMYDGGSNWGPKDATGTAVIETAAGKVTITVKGLPKLDKEVYEGWLAGGGEGACTTGRFNTDDSGAGKSAITLGDLSERTFERVVLTVEPEPDPTTDPDDRHSIGGNIPPP